MRLYLCDMALERARLAFAQIEAFAPLNGLIDDSPPKPERPSEAERKSLHDEAAKQLAIAADYIENAATTGATRSWPSCKPCCAASAPSPACHPGCDG